MTAKIKKDTYDTRPESYKIDCESIELGDSIPTDKAEWSKRAELVFKYAGWQFASVDDLAASQASTKQSIGVVIPREILSVDLVQKPDDERATFEVKREKMRTRFKSESEGVFEDFLPPELKDLEFIDQRIQVKWTCGSGAVHRMNIFDWEAVELHRRLGADKALLKVREVLDLSTHAVRFFLGNLKAHPTRFTIAGLWYPKRSKKKFEQRSLFS